MAAIAFNIRKCMKWHPKNVDENALQKTKHYLSNQLDRFTCHLGAELVFRSDDTSRDQRKKFARQLCNSHMRYVKIKIVSEN